MSEGCVQSERCVSVQPAGVRSVCSKVPTTMGCQMQGGMGRGVWGVGVVGAGVGHGNGMRGTVQVPNRRGCVGWAGAQAVGLVAQCGQRMYGVAVLGRSLQHQTCAVW